MPTSPDGLTVELLAVDLAIGAAVLIVAVAAVRLSTRTGLPSLLLYLGIGVLLGESFLGIPFEDMALTRFLSYLALALILAEGGLTTEWDDIRPAVLPALVLSTVGVATSIAVVGVAGHLLLGLELPVAVLLGAVLASTDAAAVFSVLRSVPLPTRLTGILEAESGFNDAPVILVVVALTDQLAGANAESWWQLLGTIVLELCGGAAIGAAIGWLGSVAMRLLVSGHSGLFPLGVMAWVLLAYGVASLAHTSGFIAVYLAALIMGNRRLPHRAAYRGFAQALGWLAQIGLFVMLGLLASPGQLLGHLVAALVLGVVLLGLARPLSVLTSCAWFGFTWREGVFLSWAGLRGAVPIVLATVPLLAGVPGVSWIFDLVFVLVLVFTLVQAPTLPWVARRLGVVDPDRAVALDVEAVPLEELGADLLQVHVGEGSRLHGVELFELRLPVGATVSLIVRDGESLVPNSTTVLRRGDQLLIVATPAARRRAEIQLHAIDAAGRLAGWTAARPVRGATRAGGAGFRTAQGAAGDGRREGPEGRRPARG